MTLEETCTESLTGLPYQEFFKSTAVQMIKDKLVTPVIMSIDISNFKYFNQMYGFDEGDRLIKRCVNTYCYNNGDYIIACRIYVDHIIMLIEGCSMDIASFSDKYDTMNRCFSAEVNKEFPLARIRMYTGVYFVEDRNETIGNMIDKAQYARRSIKVNYAVTIAFYSEDMRIKTESDAGVIPMFFSALENERIKVYLQPKFSIDTQELIGAEALSRIEDADGRIISPGVYVDILENSGLISKLDRYVIYKIIDIQKELMEQGRRLTVISMNLSRMDFWENDFIRKIDNRITESGVPKEYFEFELTETIFCENLSLITQQIDFLRKKGYKISMDDFGSGYNSLYMLGKIPIDIIEFDRGFVLNSLGAPMGRTIMKSLVTTFKDVNFDVICEGIESREEEAIVHECGCNAVQGYLHDKPIPYQLFMEKYL